MISVIVPVYNAQSFLERCIQSVQSQNYQDWELYAIDDGSTDSSYIILCKYRDIDPRVHVISQENQGAGRARNKGIDAVEGEYTVFLDADDYLEPSCFENLVSHKEDVVFFNAYRRNQSGKIVTIEKNSLYRNQTKDVIIRNQMTGKMPWGGWRKAVKTSLLKDNKIYYSEHRVGEEAIYSFKVLQLASSISFIEIPLYNYEVHSGSLSQSFSNDPWGGIVSALKEEIINMGLYELYANTLNAFAVTAGMISLDRLASHYNYKDFKSNARKRINEMNREIDRQYSIDIKSMDKKTIVLYILSNRNLLMVLYLLSNIRTIVRKLAK